MNRRDQNVAVFGDTMEWIRAEEKLGGAVKHSQDNTKLYRAGMVLELLMKPRYERTEVEVTAWRSFEAAMREKRKNPDCRVAVLNFASATNPGGGVTRGSSAQEEALCRCSTLYPCLNTKWLKDHFYDFHRKKHDTRYTDSCIYTPDIMIIKSDTDVPERLPKDQWTAVDVLSCAAPNLREVPYNAMNPGSGEPVKVTKEELLKLHKSRGIQILSTAAENGVDILILGAFGCGAFKNDPAVVAKAYKEILPRFSGFFRKVHFAVYCPPKDMTNYLVFSEVLNQ